MPNPDAILDANLDWADGIAREVWRKLPPSFELADLQQIARLETWFRAQEWDPKKNNNFRGYAYLWVLNAVRMAVRRRVYRDSTMDEIDGVLVDTRPTPEQELMPEPEPRNLDKLHALMALLSTTEAYLVQRVYIEGIEVSELAATWQTDKAYIARRLAAAVRTMKRARAT